MDNRNPFSYAMDEFFKKPQLVASATECTGLSQDPVLTDAERDSLTDIYDVPLAVQLSPERTE